VVELEWLEVVSLLEKKAMCEAAEIGAVVDGFVSYTIAKFAKA
jgi:hypothetical protein